MQITGEYQLDCDRDTVWAALNDPEILAASIPGCESLEVAGDNEYTAKITAKVGPVKAKFDTAISLQNLDPPSSYTLVGEAKSGAAGHGRGTADVTLEEAEGGTKLTYSADFKVGGKLAQIGSRMVLGATRKTADDFFDAFNGHLDPSLDEPPPADGINRKTWLGVGAAVVVLLIWWFLLR